MSSSWIAALLVGNLLVVTSAGAASSSPPSKYYRDPGRIDLAIQPISANIIRDTDVAMMTRDGKRLYVKVYRPQGVGRYPVIVSTSWYGKESFGDGPYREWHDQTGSDVGRMSISELTPFEQPDPAFWVPRGYVVVHADVRGAGKSEGNIGPNSQQDALDYYDLIEWAAAQSWSTGKVGLSGVAYSAYSQWFAAALHPPHLAAIMPWEGLVDHYRDAAFHGGIPETNFRLKSFTKSLEKHRNEEFDPAEDYAAMVKQHPFFDEYWDRKAAKLEEITVPALVCASWSGQGSQSRGAFEGFRGINSREKWLITHGRNQWAMYYDPEMLGIQAQFFDYYLQGKKDGMPDVPRVRLELRKTRDEFVVKQFSTWPLEGTQYLPLYLNAPNNSLATNTPRVMSQTQYDAERGKATYDFRFDRDTWIAGNMSLKVWISADTASDIDLFVGVRKFDKDGQEVYFYGFGGQPNDIVTRGWLRISERELDEDRSTIDRPMLKHTGMQKIKPGDVVSATVEILPSATVFEAGSRLQLVIQGTELVRDKMLVHGASVNRGINRIYTGGGTASQLLVPVIQPR
jgi:predicted acyl esterase